MTARSWSIALPLAFLAGGCATTTTRLAPVAPEVVAAEAERQRELAVATVSEQQRRLDDIAYPLLVAAAEFCEAEPRSGYRAGSAAAFDGDWRAAAVAALDLSDTLSVIGVTDGSPAHAAGLRIGDRIQRIAGVGPFVGTSAGKRFNEVTASVLAPGMDRYVMAVRRGSEELSLEIAPRPACPYGAHVTEEGELNAYADGKAVYITTTMMRFADDEELAVIVGHEIAHNAMDHLDAKRSNAIGGALLGAIADIAMAGAGVNTGGYYTSQGAQTGALAFSQDFEREADYVGLYLMALAEYPFDEAATFWRHMAIAAPGSITMARTHPTTAERFVRLEQTVAEIRAKLESGEPLRPNMKSDSTGVGGGDG